MSLDRESKVHNMRIARQLVKNIKTIRHDFLTNRISTYYTFVTCS